MWYFQVGISFLEDLALKRMGLSFFSPTAYEMPFAQKVKSDPNELKSFPFLWESAS